MAENKKSFLLYADLIHTINKLPDDKAGELFKLILSYVNDEDPDLDSIDFVLQIAFEPIRQSLKRDLAKYHNIVERNRLNGSKGGRPKKPNKPSGLSGNPKKPKKADNDNDSVNDIKEHTWRDDFNIYKNELREVYLDIINDDEYISLQEKYRPNLDIKLSLEKACMLYWATESGWKQKKSKKSKNIDWKQTLTNALDMNSNKVYKNRN